MLSAIGKKTCKKSIMVLLLALSVVILCFRPSTTRSGAIFVHIVRKVSQIAAPCKLSAHLVMHEAHKRNVHSQKVLSHFAVSSLRKDETRGIKGRHYSVNIGTGLPR